jgi:hypothetical protein
VDWTSFLTKSSSASSSSSSSSSLSSIAGAVDVVVVSFDEEVRFTYFLFSPVVVFPLPPPDPPLPLAIVAGWGPRFNLVRKTHSVCLEAHLLHIPSSGPEHRTLLLVHSSQVFFNTRENRSVGISTRSPFASSSICLWNIYPSLHLSLPFMANLDKYLWIAVARVWGDAVLLESKKKKKHLKMCVK